MKTRKFLSMMAFFLAAFMIISGCKKDKDDPEPTINYYEVMTTYMSDNGMDLSDVTSQWIITAADVVAQGDTNFYIMDIRQPVDYDSGHIANAVNTTLGNVLTEAQNANGKPILLVCYTGQSASHAHVALRLSGYSDCKVLKFGMSSWNGDFDKWTANTGDLAIGHTNWSATNTIQTPVTFSAPEFTATATDGAGILAERVSYMLTEGFKGVLGSDVLNTPTNYFINNYWGSTDVDQYGHIVGAYRIKEDLTIAAGGFQNLDPSQTVVTYCWTGQTSSLVTAYLTVLGFDAKSLKFGVNGFIYSNLQGHKWTASGSYPYVQ